MNTIQKIIQESIDLKQQVLKDVLLLSTVQKVVALLIESFKNKQKVLFCGNGGSAADAQHLATELSGRFYLDRPPLFAEALPINTPYLTAVANDYGYEYIFSRLVEAKGQAKDVLIGLSTSGNSPNVVEAFKMANSMNLITVGFTGNSGGKLKEYCDYLINIPSTDTPRIQEVHLLIGHIVCELVEKALFNQTLNQ